MARRRALIAGLGTTGLLVALALLLLAVVGALLAFHGWPGSGGVGSAEGVSLDAGRLVSAGPPSFAEAATPAARAARARERRAQGSHGGGAADRQQVAGIRRTLSAGGADGRGPSAAAPGMSPGSSRPAPAGADNVADAVKGVAGGAEEQLGNTTAPVGQLVVNTGSAVSETVRELGSKVKVETKQP
jgi:hypothetical protein